MSELKTKILLFGSNSEIGQKIYSFLSKENFVIPLHRGFRFEGSQTKLIYDSYLNRMV